MKPFDLEAAKAGAPVITRDGRPARIICFDKIGSEWPLIVLIYNGDSERLNGFTLKGTMWKSQEPDPRDLFMAPVKKEGWVILYKSKFGNVYPYPQVYKTKQDAHFCPPMPAEGEKYLGAVPIEWEE